MLRVNIVGIGPGNPELLTAAARQAIADSNILIGDKRMLANFAAAGKTVHATIKITDIAAIAAAADPDKDTVAVLVSGDVGFFSLAKSISGRLPDCECVRFCGISSLVYFASRLQMSWDDAKIVSMHGREQKLTASVAANAKVFSLTGGENSAGALCAQLCRRGLGHVQVYVGENLSYPEEKITCGTAEELSGKSFPSLSVMMILNERPLRQASAVHGLADDCFLRGKAPMTKQEVRSVSLSKLQPEATDIIFDIGAGTGSCSVELALLAPAGKVYAFERSADALELLHTNKERLGADSLEIVPGDALTNIRRLLAAGTVPDCVFVGGSGGDLCEMLDAIYLQNPACRIVINAITVETLAEVAAYYKKRQEYALEIVNVFVARGKKLGSYNLMMAQNPVYVMTAVKRDEQDA